jgi:hypothetical protein
MVPKERAGHDDRTTVVAVGKPLGGGAVFLGVEPLFTDLLRERGQVLQQSERVRTVVTSAVKRTLPRGFHSSERSVRLGAKARVERLSSIPNAVCQAARAVDGMSS